MYKNTYSCNILNKIEENFYNCGKTGHTKVHEPARGTAEMMTSSRMKSAIFFMRIASSLCIPTY